jgi:hypothetical protein
LIYVEKISYPSSEVLAKCAGEAVQDLLSKLTPHPMMDLETKVPDGNALEDEVFSQVFESTHDAL